MKVQYASVELKQAALSSDFGKQLFVKKFGEQAASMIMEAFGVYKSGPRKGLQRGYLHWEKCTVGGWYRSLNGSSQGGVRKPGSRNYRACLGSKELVPQDSTAFERKEAYLKYIARILDE